MIVGGPNVRNDYHLQAGEEFFWQMKGDLCLNVVLNGKFAQVTSPGRSLVGSNSRCFPRKIHVPEGHCCLLPSHIPHSPQRGANSAGIVVERAHTNTQEKDGFARVLFTS
jgi:3-hydroxyanthranilate 3,4-dioxygenase